MKRLFGILSLGVLALSLCTGASWLFLGTNGPTSYPVGTHSLYLDNSATQYLNGGNIFAKEASTDAFSFAYWARVESVSAFRTIFSKTTAGSNVGYRCFFPNSGNILQFQMVSSTGGNLVRNSVASVSAATWYHVVTTKSAGVAATTLTHYINGAATTTTNLDTLTTGSTVTSDNFNLGRNTTGSNLYFYGYVFDMALYNVELTSGEVGDLYNSGTPDDVRNMSWYDAGEVFAYWKFGDGTGDTYSTIYDQVNSNNLTGVNTTSGSIVSLAP